MSSNAVSRPVPERRSQKGSFVPRLNPRPRLLISPLK